MTKHATYPPKHPNPLRPHDSELTSYRHVVLEADGREIVDVHGLAEDQAVRRAAEVEHAELVALLDVLALLHRDLARAHLVHADGDEGHEADGGVVGLDEEDGARGESGEVL